MSRAKPRRRSLSWQLLLTGSAIAATVTLVLTGTSGSYALWNASVVVDAGILHLAPAPTVPSAPAAKTGAENSRMPATKSRTAAPLSSATLTPSVQKPAAPSAPSLTPPQTGNESGGAPATTSDGNLADKVDTLAVSTPAPAPAPTVDTASAAPAASTLPGETSATTSTTPVVEAPASTTAPGESDDPTMVPTP